MRIVVDVCAVARARREIARGDGKSRCACDEIGILILCVRSNVGEIALNEFSIVQTKRVGELKKRCPCNQCEKRQCGNRFEFEFECTTCQNEDQKRETKTREPDSNPKRIHDEIP